MIRLWFWLILVLICPLCGWAESDDFCGSRSAAHYCSHQIGELCQCAKSEMRLCDCPVQSKPAPLRPSLPQLDIDCPAPVEPVVAKVTFLGLGTYVAPSAPSLPGHAPEPPPPRP
jgi:hypothetical protein